MTLDRVEFFDNEVSGDGAAVSTSGGTALTTIDHCDFHQNVAAGAGGAIAVRGAGYARQPSPALCFGSAALDRPEW